MSDKIQKLLMGRNGFQLNFGFDFQKATDETKRTVVGFATIDNLDQTGDIVLAKASEEAFRTFRGNIREQHNKYSAVGRMIAFEPAEYTDSSGKVYKGVRVAVRISEGAEDTWKKCLDGTYSGFSIGGAILDKEPHFDKESGKTVNVITKYRLTELSLVDNPANEMANFETVYKALDYDEDLEKTFDLQNLFWCPADGVAAKSNQDSYPCAACGENMARIGTVSENEDMKEKLTKVLSELEINTEGVIPTMPQEIKKNADGTEEVDETKVEAPEVEADAAENAAETETKETDSDVSETLAALQAQLNDVVSTVKELASTAKANDLTAIEEKLEKLITENASLAKKVEEKEAEFGEFKKTLESTGERVEKIASATAMKTSEDLVPEEVEKVNDSKSDDGWNGLFSGVYNKFNLSE